jgi:hypothetical protein
MLVEQVSLDKSESETVGHSFTPQILGPEAFPPRKYAYNMSTEDSGDLAN